MLRTRAVVLAVLALLAACRFELERDLQPGDVRGIAVLASDVGDEPVAGARVVLEGSRIETRTDAKGRFVLRGVPDGEFVLRATADVDGDGESDLGLRRRGTVGGSGSRTGAVDLGQLTLGAAGTIDGRVVRDGEPIAGARVSGPGLATTVTGTDGRFRFDRVLPAEYGLSVEVREDASAVLYGSRAVTVEARQNVPAELEVTTLPRGSAGTISGSVRQIGVDDRVGTHLLLVGAGEQHVGATQSDADGRFLLGPVPGGIYALLVTAPDGASLRLEPVIVDGDLALPEILLVTADMLDDDDGDGVLDDADLCPQAWDPAQADLDEDTIGDACDDDRDGDGIPNLDDRTILLVSGLGQEATPTATFTAPIVLALRDGNGAPVTNAALNVTIVTGQGEPSTLAPRTDALGLTSFTVTAGALAGPLGFEVGVENAEALTVTLTVVPGPLAALELETESLPETTAGAPIPLAARLVDAFGNPRTGDEALLDVTVTDALAVGPAQVEVVNGEAAFGIELRTAGDQTIEVRANGVPEAATRTFVVTPGAAASIGAQPAAGLDAVAGEEVEFVVVGFDAFGNEGAPWTGELGFSADGASPVLPEAWAVTPTDEGRVTLRGSFRTAGSWTLTITDHVAGFSTTLPVRVAPGEARGIMLGAPDPVDAGTPFTLTASLTDLWGNVAPGLATTVVAGPFSEPENRVSIEIDPATGTGSAQMTLHEAGFQLFSVTSEEFFAEFALTVRAGPASALTITLPETVDAGIARLVSVKLVDAWGNAASAAPGTLLLTTDDPLAPEIPSIAWNPTMDAEAMVEFRTAGTQTLTASFGDISGSATLLVEHGEVFAISVAAGASPPAGATTSVSIELFDQFDNPVTSATTIDVSVNDAGAKVPGVVSVSDGAATLEVRPSKAGTLVVSATTGVVTGSDTLDVLVPELGATSVSVLPVANRRGEYVIEFTLTQAQGFPVDVKLATQDGTPLTLAAADATNLATSGLRGLASSPTGVTHRIAWSAARDFPGANVAGERVRLTARVRGGTDQITLSPPFALDLRPAFTTRSTIGSTGAPGGLVLADVNFDGWSDALEVRGAELRTRTGDRLGDFGAPNVRTLPGADCRRPALGRRSDDATWIAYVPCPASGTLVALPNPAGTGTDRSLTGFAGVSHVVATDLTGDGTDELVVASSSGNLVGAAYDSGSALNVDTPFAISGSGPIGDLASADLDGDGDLDVAVLRGGSTASLHFLRNDLGTLVDALQTAVQPDATRLLAIDHDGAGGRELVVLGGGAISVLRLVAGAFEAVASVPGFMTIAGAVGDFDRDGRLDLAVENAGQANLVVSRSTSLAPFPVDATLNAYVSLSGGAFDLASADVDRDGLPDLVAQTGTDLLVLRNTSPVPAGGRFDAPIAFTEPDPVSTLALDLDGDGRTDLVSAHAGTTPRLVLRRAIGIGDFAPPVVVNSVNVGDARALVAIDLDGNGRKDVGVLDTTAGAFVVYENTTSGTTLSLGAPNGYLLGLATYGAPAVADLDRDGDDDLLIGEVNESGGSKLLRLDGGATTRLTRLEDTDWGAHSIAIADLDADGRLDYATGSSSSIEVFLQKPFGAFEALAWTNFGNATAAIAFHDADGDGVTDLYQLSSGFNEISVKRGNGDGSFETSWSPYRAGVFAGSRTMQLADVNADGFVDAVVTGETTFDKEICFVPGIAGGGFTTQLVRYLDVAAGTPALGDFDDDGRPDVALALGGETWVARSRFAPLGFPTTFGTNGQTSRLAHGDLFGDGAHDFVAAGQVAHMNYMPFTPGPTSGGSGQYATGGVVTDLTVGRFNRDAYDDVVVAQASGSPSLQLFRGSDASLFPGAIGAFSAATVASGDFDRDGDLDLLINSGTRAEVELLLNDGNGTFTLEQTAGFSGIPTELHLADFDGDGWLDLLAAVPSLDRVVIGFNDGTGLFGAFGSHPVAQKPTSVAVGDLDRDGRADFVIAGNTTNAWPYLVTSRTTVTARPSLYPPAPPGRLRLADVDADGDLDLVVPLPSKRSFAVHAWSGAGFEAPTLWGVGLGPDSSAVFDFDRDGRPDLLGHVAPGAELGLLRGQ